MLKNHLIARDSKYLSLGVGFLAAMLVFSMAAAAGAIIIAQPALAQIGGGSAGVGGSIDGSTTITDAQIRLAQAMTALQNKNTTGAMMQLKLLNQSLSTLSTGVGGMATSGVNPGPGPSTGSPSSQSTVNPGPGPSTGSPSSPSTVNPGPGPSTVNPGPGPSTVNPGPGPSTGSAGPGPSGGLGAGSSGPGISGGGGHGAGSSGAGR